MGKIRDVGVPTVPAPTPPDDPDAWYAPEVREQDEVYPGVVVTIRRTDREFRYEVREPLLSAAERDALSSVESHFQGANIERPRTREGAQVVCPATVRSSRAFAA